jgi:hypothetical protein
LENRCVPSTITPTTFADGSLGSGSLRDPVLQFNADSGTADDTIQLQAGTYSLTIRNSGGRHETAGLTGDLNLTQTSHRWVIQGAGSSGDNATIIDASQLQDRVFQIVNPGTQVVFQDLIIQGGLAQDDGSDGAVQGTTAALGGGILNNGGDIALDNVVVQNNVARGGNGTIFYRDAYCAQGGGLYSTGGAVTISGGAIANNRASGGRGADGYGGALNGGNGASGYGGGLYAVAGSVDISGSTIGNNRATGGDGGGGAFSTGSSGETPAGNGGNGGAGQGGGLYVNGAFLTISNSTIASNQVGGGSEGGCAHLIRQCYTGGAGDGLGGGIRLAGGTASIQQTTVAANQAVGGGDGGAGSGGGLSVTGGTVSIQQTTIAANQARGGYGGAGSGGGLSVMGSAFVEVLSITVSMNQAVGGSGHFAGTAMGGGVFNSGGLQVRNTIVAGNTVDGPGTNSAPDLSGDLGSLGHNLIGTSDGGSGFDATDLLDVDPMLGPLQDNGGPTPTMALLPGSPAIDAGDNTGAPDWDQRGPAYPRIVNGIIDIGAFEYQGGGSGPAASPPGPTDVAIRTASASVLPLGSDHPALLAPVPSAGPPSTRGAADDLPRTAAMPSRARVASADRWLAGLREKREPRPLCWAGLQPTAVAEWFPDLPAEEVNRFP